MMANEKRLIDANALVDKFWQPECRTQTRRDFVAMVNYAPTVDAVEVVRCENCQYWNPRYETMGMCMKHNAIVTFTKPDFYCAWGKGKSDGICKED